MKYKIYKHITRTSQVYYTVNWWSLWYYIKECNVAGPYRRQFYSLAEAEDAVKRETAYFINLRRPTKEVVKIG